MSVKVNYDATTGEIKGFYPDSFGYSSIPEPYIEIDEETHQDCINNSGRRRVDLTTLRIVEYTPEVKTVTQESESVDPTILAFAEALAAQEERIAKLEGSASK